MTHAAPDSVASGLPYPITHVGGAAPTSLDEFISETEFVLDKHGTPSTVCGHGAQVDGAVRFHEKSSTGKDSRTWRISRSAAGGFVAEALGHH